MADINKIVAKNQIKHLLKSLDTSIFIAHLEPLVHIWNHLLEDHHRKAKNEYRTLATAMDSTSE